ncbi:response regulator [Cupriavidus sp. H18C2]|uniref:response regulator n=1 Tax=Cupriavidus sp. H18C2 TaxID=3241602 RepID=UPI003BF8DC3D
MAAVVVIDDEEMNADALAFMLAAEGMSVRTATNGEAGLQLIAEERPDLVITDFMMPVMTGLEFAEKLRANAATADIPVILLSAAQANIGRQHPHLFNVVFEKPCHPPRIIEAISQLLNDHK